MSGLTDEQIIIFSMRLSKIDLNSSQMYDNWNLLVSNTLSTVYTMHIQTSECRRPGGLTDAQLLQLRGHLINLITYIIIIYIPTVSVMMWSVSNVVVV